MLRLKKDSYKSNKWKILMAQNMFWRECWLFLFVLVQTATKAIQGKYKIRVIKKLLKWLLRNHRRIRKETVNSQYQCILPKILPLKKKERLISSVQWVLFVVNYWTFKRKTPWRLFRRPRQRNFPKIQVLQKGFKQKIEKW